MGCASSTLGRKLPHLKAYKEREGNCEVPPDHIQNGVKLGRWLIKQRSKMNTLPDDCRRQLNELGIVWHVRDARWEEGYRHLKAYKEREGDCLVPLSHKENDFPLGTWVSNQRARAESLSATRRGQLDQLGFVWDPLEANWEKGFFHLKTYKEREGHCQVPHSHIENDFKLGYWVNTQRTNKDDLSKERRDRLDEVEFVWDRLAAAWEEGFLHLKAYREREGHCRVPARHKENDNPLGQWVGVQRTNDDDLSEERRQRLDELGFVWDPFAADWEKGFHYLKTYKEREGHCLVPHAHKENGFKLGSWVNVQRTNQNLSEERRQRLNKLGFVWDVLESAWEKGLGHLKTYREREGHCHVPLSHKENGFPLGQWVNVQRGRAESLSVIRREQLDQLGFVWTPREANWEKGFLHLEAYKEREGHCSVPARHRENGFWLGAWVDRQRQNKDSLSEWQRQQLEKLGFIWST